MTNIAVILAGCGYLDGTEVRESVLTLLALDRAGATVSMFAPNISQMHVVNHLTGEEVPGETRNVLEESARIARGKITPLSDANADNFDALLIPGGFGVAKNLSDLALKGGDATVLPEFKALIEQFITAKKPIGAICISPAVLTAALKGKISPTVTIGDDTDNLIASMGATHKTCATDMIAVDEDNKIASCSAYMRDDASISDVAAGIEKVVGHIITWAEN